jgi:hypothetical protein
MIKPEKKLILDFHDNVFQDTAHVTFILDQVRFKLPHIVSTPQSFNHGLTPLRQTEARMAREDEVRRICVRNWAIRLYMI